MPTAPPHLRAVTRTHDEQLAVDLTVPAHSSEVGAVRAAVSRVARQAGMPEERLGDVTLAVGEACANAVVHAYAGRDPGLLHVRARVTPDGLEVVVADDGHGLAPRSDSPGLGLGLPLMTSLTSALEFRTGSSGGTEIWMVFSLREGAAGADWARTG